MKKVKIIYLAFILILSGCEDDRPLRSQLPFQVGTPVIIKGLNQSGVVTGMGIYCRDVMIKDDYGKFITLTLDNNVLITNTEGRVER